MTTTPQPRRFSLPRFFRVRRLPWLVAWLVAAVTFTYRWTLRVRVRDPYGLLHTSFRSGCVVALWHNRIPFTGLCFPLAIRRRSTVLISASRDGEYAAAIVARVGMHSVRGSSSRRGARALRELAEVVERGDIVVITLDGPRGPRYEPHPGAAALAATCGAPLIPISVNAPRRVELRSWDRTQLPLPFSRIELVVGAALRLDTPDEASLDTVKAALMAITDDRRGNAPAA